MVRIISASLIIVFFLASSPLWAGVVATAKCKSYQMVLKSKTPNFEELMVLEKVKKSGGVQGRWKMKKYEQRHIFLAPSGIQKQGSRRDDLGHGMWMKTDWIIADDEAFTFYADGKVLFDVVDNKIGYTGSDTWVGTVEGDQVTINWPGSASTAPLTGTAHLGGGTETIKVDVIMPSPNERFVFTEANPGKFKVHGLAEVTPAQYANQLVWKASEMDGTTINVQGSGKVAEIHYEKLPPKNDQFGEQTITATLDVDGCVAEANIPIRVFYLRDKKNNPGGQYPNWFYYWKQTGAAKPEGQNIIIEYGGTTFDVCTHPKTVALFKPGYGHKTVHVCDLRRLGAEMENKYPLIEHAEPAFPTQWGYSKYIDTFALGILHEHVHMKIYNNWKHGKTHAQLLQEDADQDGLPSSAEPGLNFDPAKIQTFGLLDNDLKNIGSDEEWMAFSVMKNYVLGTYNGVDWAVPGKQWPN